MEYKTQCEQIQFQAGIQQGVQLGMQQGQSQMLQFLLEAKFGQLSHEIQGKIENADEEILLRWCKNMLGASALDAVFQ